MKNNFLFLLIVLLAGTGTGCKKNTEVPAPDPNAIGISAKINGEWHSFFFQPLGRQWNSYSYTFEGSEGSTSGNQISIAIDSPTPLTTGVYSSNSTPGVSVRIFYGGFYGFLGYSSWEVTNSPGFGRREETVTISEINSVSVKGSFSCTLFSASFIDLTKIKTLTNGNFNVKF
ncbi:MAG: hypothetical protein ABJA85_02345 [Bacteroidota bacterium]